MGQPAEIKVEANAVEETVKKEFVMRINENDMQIENNGINMVDVFGAIGVFIGQMMIEGSKDAPMPHEMAARFALEQAMDAVSNGISAVCAEKFGESFFADEESEEPAEEPTN